MMQLDLLALVSAAWGFCNRIKIIILAIVTAVDLFHAGQKLLFVYNQDLDMAVSIA